MGLNAGIGGRAGFTGYFCGLPKFNGKSNGRQETKTSNNNPKEGKAKSKIQQSRVKRLGKQTIIKTRKERHTHDSQGGEII